MVKKLYKGGKTRAVTFSFDDGRAQDMRLINIFNKYNLKGTFNLSAGRCLNDCFVIQKDRKYWDGSDELREVYKGHEVASHSYSHLHMPELSEKECEDEIRLDIEALQQAFGYKIRGFASPYGKSNDYIKSLLVKYGICYRRGVSKKFDFDLPESFYDWSPSPHFSYYSNDEGKKLLKDFFSSDTEMPVLYIWGHSYEITKFDDEKLNAKFSGIQNRWEYVDSLCKALSGKDDVWYATNIEICDYVNAMRKAKVDETYIDNPSDLELYFLINGKVITAPPHSRFSL